MGTSKLRVSPDTVIYVLCPSHIVTGGIEAVHQLVDKLRKFGHNAVIVPNPPVNNPLLLQYRNYDVSFARQIIDDECNILVTTEVNPWVLDAFQSIQKALWWLSVDNHEALEQRFDFDSIKNQDVVHFFQSAYAHDFLCRKGIVDSCSLTDYLHACYFHRQGGKPKGDNVLYTPAKGAQEYVNQLQQADASIQWLPLRGMIRKRHAQVLRQGKVYVDFGAHPGKDRQPREAVVNGCCVLVGRKGAACFAEDVPVPEAYRFPCQPFDPWPIVSTIKDCLADYRKRSLDFAPYAALVCQEESQFETEVISIFGLRSCQRRWHSLTVFANTLAFIKQNHLFDASRGLANEMLPIAVTDLARQTYKKFDAKHAQK